MTGVTEEVLAMLLGLQHHYPRIVYLFVCFWRKAYFMIQKQLKSPSAAGPRLSLRAGALQGPEHLAQAGILNKICQYLPMKLLAQGKPFTMDDLNDDGGNTTGLG